MFVNLPVRDLKRSVDFFTKLGFRFEPKFTDQNATCMIVGEDAFVMLLVEPFFKTFTKRQLCDTRTHTEGLFAIAVGSRAEVDQLVKTAVATTTDTDESGPRTSGRINGGFFQRKPDWPAQHPSIVIAVDDIDRSMRKVRDAGGHVLGEPVEMPGVGQYVSFTDTEGNRVSMLQPIPRNWHAPKSA